MPRNLWLNDALRRSLNPTLPQIENTDGDPLEFITVHFPLISKAKLPASRQEPGLTNGAGHPDMMVPEVMKNVMPQTSVMPH